VFSNW